MIDYALNRSFEDMVSTLTKAKAELNNESLKKEASYRVGTFLHWLMNKYERIEVDNKNIPNETKAFFSGLRYANNKLKHDISTIQIYQRTGGFSFPISFPLSIPPIEFKWNLGTQNNDTRYKKQLDNYILYIQNQNILEISKKAIDIIAELENN